MSSKEDQAITKQVGYIKNYHTNMDISQIKWDLIFHTPKNCSGAKRSTGCVVCKHDADTCNVKSCPICKAI